MPTLNKKRHGCTSSLPRLQRVPRPLGHAPCCTPLIAPLRAGTQPGRAAARIPGGCDRAGLRRGPAAGHCLGRMPGGRSHARRRQPALWRRGRGLTGAAPPACICRICICCDSASAATLHATQSPDSCSMLSAPIQSVSMHLRSRDDRKHMRAGLLHAELAQAHALAAISALAAQACKRVQLQNTGDLAARFAWDAASLGPCFSVSPAEGAVDAGQEAALEVTFRPTSVAPDFCAKQARALQCSQRLCSPDHIVLTSACAAIALIFNMPCTPVGFRPWKDAMHCLIPFASLVLVCRVKSSTQYNQSLQLGCSAGALPRGGRPGLPARAQRRGRPGRAGGGRDRVRHARAHAADAAAHHSKPYRRAMAPAASRTAGGRPLVGARPGPGARRWQRGVRRDVQPGRDNAAKRRGVRGQRVPSAAGRRRAAACAARRRRAAAGRRRAELPGVPRPLRAREGRAGLQAA